MLRRLFPVLALLLLWPTVCLSAAPRLVAIVQGRTSGGHGQIAAALAEGLRQGMPDVMLKEYELDDERSLGPIVAARPDLIIPFGTSATRLLSRSITDIPIVFTAVLTPPGGIERPPHMTGVTLDIPPANQLEIIRHVLPESRKLGILYSPEENQATVEAISVVSKGVGIGIVASAVNGPKDITISDSSEYDALWLIPDTVVCQPAIVKQLLVNSLKTNMPIIGISPSYAKSGAVLAMSADYDEVGRQTARLALEILSGKKPADLSIEAPRKFNIYLNVAVAKKIGIDFPASLLAEATEVFGR